MPQLDVVPSALVHAAAAVRSVARDLEAPTLHADVGDVALARAVADFGSRWSSALAELAEAAGECALTLQESAGEYVALDSLLVPRALR